MAFNQAAPNPESSGSAETARAGNEISSLFSALPADDAAGLVFAILDQYAITLDTQNYPANLYAESLLYMIYWFHRLRDPIRKSGMESSIGKYLNVDPHSPVVNALLFDQGLRIKARQRIDQGVMIRKTVDVLVMRDGPSGREFLALDRAFSPRAWPCRAV